MAALLYWKMMGSHAKSENPVQLGIPHGCLPIRWANRMLWASKPAMVCAQFDPRGWGQPGVLWQAVQICLPALIKTILEVTNINCNGRIRHQRQGLAQTRETLEQLGSPAKFAASKR